ncbi:MAG: hypothetical protein ABR508_11945 [Candidatus Baltobacteraceae bacterium]
MSARTASVSGTDPIARMTPAPVKPDYRFRDKTITFLESRYKKDSVDMITPRMLAGEYLQRYREHGDIGDVLRAEAAAKTSLAAFPRYVPADLTLAGVEVTLHRFREAKGLIRSASLGRAGDPSIALDEASVDLELGAYDEARKLIEATRGKAPIASDVVIARWDEISGDLREAEPLLERAMRYADSIYDVPAERRAWYHFRLGELRYLRGDNEGALAAERDALTIYPDDLNALQALARIALANKAYDVAEDAAKRSVAIVPSPETLGILADAQEHFGRTAEAAASRAEIDAVEKIGNAQHVNDRLIAVYLADHGVRVDDAYAIAKRELALRRDVYAEDTLAWCAAKAGHWNEARIAARKALRFDTEDPRIQYHAGVIAQQAGDTSEARKRYERALALNPRFSATGADDARARLEAIQK